MESHSHYQRSTKALETEQPIKAITAFFQNCANVNYKFSATTTLKFKW